MGSLENNFVYALMGEINLMLYPYITTIGISKDDTSMKSVRSMHLTSQMIAERIYRP